MKNIICRIELKACRKGYPGIDVVKFVYDRFGSVHDVALQMTGNPERTEQYYNRNGYNREVKEIPNTQGFEAPNWGFIIITEDDYKHKNHIEIISKIALHSCKDHIHDLNTFTRWAHDQNTTEGYFKAILHNQFRLEGYDMASPSEIPPAPKRKRADLFPRLPILQM